MAKVWLIALLAVYACSTVAESSIVDATQLPMFRTLESAELIIDRFLGKAHLDVSLLTLDLAGELLRKAKSALLMPVSDNICRSKLIDCSRISPEELCLTSNSKLPRVKWEDVFLQQGVVLDDVCDDIRQISQMFDNAFITAACFSAPIALTLVYFANASVPLVSKVVLKYLGLEHFFSQISAQPFLWHGHHHYFFRTDRLLRSHRCSGSPSRTS